MPPSVACGRLRSGARNYLFAGGERAAAICSLLGSAKLNGIDPEAFMTAVLRRIADHPISRITDSCPGMCPAAGEKTEVRDTQIQLNRNRVHHRALAETIQNETRTLLMNWQTLESEMLASVAYDAEKQILFLRFRKTGDVYRYFRFPAAEYHAFIIAESHGRFFLAHIRDKYPNERMAKLRAA